MAVRLCPSFAPLVKPKPYRLVLASTSPVTRLHSQVEKTGVHIHEIRAKCRTQRCLNYRAVSLMRLALFPVLFAVGMSSVAQAQSSIDRPKVAIDTVELEGTLLPEPIQERLVTSLTQREYDEDSDWIKEVNEVVGRAETEGWPDRENQGYIYRLLFFGAVETATPRAGAAARASNRLRRRRPAKKAGED